MENQVDWLWCRWSFRKPGQERWARTLGKNAGVAAKLKEDAPWLIDIHCLPHRLELALLELQRSCASVEKIYEVLHLIWKTYHYSPKSTRELKAVADTMSIVC